MDLNSMEEKNMKKKNLKKTIPIGVVLLFIGASVPSHALQTTRHVETTSCNGNIFYVGGSGPGNYTTIQQAIDNASSGDTIFVYSGTYYGDIDISKSLTIIGENKDTTIINEVSTYDEFTVIYTHDVLVKNFTFMIPVWIEDSTNIVITDNILENAYLYVKGYHFNYNTTRNVHVKNNIITYTGFWYAVRISWMNGIIFENNTIINSNWGIHCSADNAIIRYNHVENCERGIEIGASGYEQPNGVKGEVHHNTVINNEWGIALYNRSNWKVYRNTVENNSVVGIYLYTPKKVVVFENNINTTSGHKAFIAPTILRFFIDRFTPYGTVWSNNYWGEPAEKYSIPACFPRIGERLNGIFGIPISYPLIPLVKEFDNNPAQTPHII